VESAGSFVPYVNISARLPEKPDQGLFASVGATGYPTVVVMDLAGEVILREDGRGKFRPTTRKRVTEAVEIVGELIVARDRLSSSPRDVVARATVTLIEVLLTGKNSSSEAMEKALAVEGIPASLKKKARNWLYLRPIQEVLNRYVASVQKLSRSDREGRNRAFQRAASDMYGCYLRGVEAANPRDSVHSDYWRLVFQGAMLEEDLQAAKDALKRYQQAYGSNPTFLERLRRMQKALGDLREKLESPNTPGDGESRGARGSR